MENSFNGIDTYDESINLKHEIARFLRFWPWFLISVLLAFFCAFFYLRYAPRVYEASAKIKILDDSEGLELPTSAFVFKRKNINLENEIEILSSYLILEKVTRELNLNTNIYEEGSIQTTRRANLPFVFHQIIKSDSVPAFMSYTIDIDDKGFEVTNNNTDKVFKFDNHDSFVSDHHLPFQIRVDDKQDLKDLIGKRFIINFLPLKNSVLNLKSKLDIQPIGEQSDLLKLTLKGENIERTESILNKLTEVFDDDGVKDRQLVSERTLEFIDDRFEFLALELDTIEVNRKDFKQDNDLVDLAVDTQIGLTQREESNKEVFRVENQLALSQYLLESLNDNKKDLMPNNIGLDNSIVNDLIINYNKSVVRKLKLMSSGGSNNPTVKLLTSEIMDLRNNINQSLESYNVQLKVTLARLKSRNKRFSGQVSQIPQKEKLLRAIERQQKIKESLYLLLLQKREEAAINLAITEPSIKVVERAISKSTPISPKPRIIYAGSILGGLLIPFGILYLIFMLDTKVHTKEDIVKVNTEIPVIAEIPDIKKSKDKIFKNPNDRSVLAESFRILSSNVDYILPVKNGEKGKVIYCTSTIKGEGKTYISLNLSLALSSINKRVLLVGADLRNPQIHTHINEDKHKPGLSNYLHDVKNKWHDSLIKGFDKHPLHDIILSGNIPPNPAHLLTNGRFKKLIEEAREEYDYIIVDTAPTILVTDTMLISQLADATIYIVRADYTERNLLNFSKELSNTGKLKNTAYVINGVGASKSYGYSYNYGYNYGYGSKT